MRKNIFLTTSALLFVVMVFISGCKKPDAVIPTQTVGYALADYLGCTSFASTQYTDTLIDTITAAGIQQAFTTSGITYNISKVTTSKLNALNVSLWNGGSGSLNSISTIQVYLNSAGSAGLGVEIASAANIPTNATTVALTLTNAELKSYLGTNNVVTILVKNAGYGNGICLDFGQGVIVSQVQTQ
jgi:hypothetical protein